jgi:UDP-N-acetylglucosamine 2-epimerase (non-hydrolysing)
MLGDIENVHLIKTLSYLPFVSLMMQAKIILTDSGGVQEEAPSLGKPVLVLRSTTERSEAVDVGTVKLIGTEYEAIIDNVCSLFDIGAAYEKMAKAINPYGGGKACDKIMRVLVS